jgi:glutamate transport system substrate-binding protein
MRSDRARVSMAVASALALLVGCSPTPDDPSILSGTIIVGVANDAPGFAVGNTPPAGFDINLMNAIGHGLGKRVTPTLIKSADRAATLKTGNAMIVIHTYSITSSRNLDGIDFAGPYMISTQALLVRADDEQIKAKDDLKGKTVCVIGTTTGEKVNIPGAIKVGQPTTKQCVDQLTEKNTDAVFTDTLLLYGYARAYRDKLKVALPGVFGENQYYGVGLFKDHKADCLKLNEIIREYLRTQWRQDFQATLPAAVAAFPGNDTNTGDFESQFKPTDNDMARLSCKL